MYWKIHFGYPVQIPLS
uniref:Uncharacterized protein n=1 Tax=Arundo donax TaxID=35708 RepID=A0A0A8ZX10_ARUDO